MENSNGTEASTDLVAHRREFQPPNGSPIFRETEIPLESPKHVQIYRAERTTSDDNLQQIGQTLWVSTKEIGKSGTGSVVYEGRYNGKFVAVKRTLQSHSTMADQEIETFIRISGENKNIVSYYGMERDTDFIYLILGLCDCNLDNLIQMYSTNSSKHQPVSEYWEKVKNRFGDVKLWKENKRPSPSLLKLMRGIVSGVVELHKSRILHGDLKPENVLVTTESSDLCAKVSDMGSSIILPFHCDNKYSLRLAKHHSRCGTRGWKAKECLLADDQHLTSAMDSFSLGCLLFYCITVGIHPFGDLPDERNMNIRKDIVPNLHLIDEFPEAFELISGLLKANYPERPTANEALHHPLFWDAERRLSFLHDTGDRVTKNFDIFNALQSTAETIFDTKTLCCGNVDLNWDKKVNEDIITHVSEQTREAYKFNSVGDLLRLIGYIYKNQEQPKIKGRVGSCSEEIDDYFTKLFPNLLIEVYKVVRKHCQEDEHFGHHFDYEGKILWYSPYIWAPVCFYDDSEDFPSL